MVSILLQLWLKIAALTESFVTRLMGQKIAIELSL